MFAKIMKRAGWITVFFVLVSVVFAEDKPVEKKKDKEQLIELNQAEKLYQEAWYKETALNDFKGAVVLYKKIVEEYTEDKTITAKALLQIGGCYEKSGKNLATQAVQTYERIINDYPEQEEIANKARARLNELKHVQTAAKNTHDRKEIEYFRKEILKLLRELESEDLDSVPAQSKRSLANILSGIDAQEITTAQEVKKRLHALYKDLEPARTDEAQEIRKKILKILQIEHPRTAYKTKTMEIRMSSQKNLSFPYIAAGYIYTNFNNRLHLDNAAGARIKIGLLKKDFFLEYQQINTQMDLLNNDDDVMVKTFLLGKGMWGLSIKAGVQKYQGTEPEDTAPMISFGLGFGIDFTKNISFGPAGTWDIVWTDANDDKIHVRDSKSFALTLAIEF